MMEFLAKVSSHVGNNKMTPKNLATIWGAVFLKSSDADMVASDFSVLQSAGQIMDLALIMVIRVQRFRLTKSQINNYTVLFSDDEEI